MLGNFSDGVKCELCHGTLAADPESTMEDYATVMNTNATNIFENVDSLLNKHIVYTCMSCGNKVKYTYKELEREFRKVLTEKFLMLVVKGLMNDVEAITGQYFIYCGKCQGFDGCGGCPISVFDKCEIKRFPVNEL